MRYTSAEDMIEDDFGDPLTHLEGEVVYDAVIKNGQWATMTQASFERHGKGTLGLGLGQKYVRNAEGELWKVEG